MVVEQLFHLIFHCLHCFNLHINLQDFYQASTTPSAIICTRFEVINGLLQLRKSQPRKHTLVRAHTMLPELFKPSIVDHSFSLEIQESRLPMLISSYPENKLQREPFVAPSLFVDGML